MKEDFTFNQLIPFYLAVLFIAFSLLLYFKSRKTYAIVLLTLASLVISIFIARLDAFLILWDEQFHALVAKNMIDNPFKPVLYREIYLDYNYKNWTANYIWLHKQPLFLWQMAFSMKLWGINEFGVRFPSVVMHTLITLLIYRIGSLTVDKRHGFVGALFFTVAYYPLELVAGRFSTDHNDVAILFYITASFWSLCEYYTTGKRYWLYLTGLFSGMAVLVKWLIGLLIYAGWMFAGINFSKMKLKKEVIRDLFKSLLIAIIVFLPWQIYILLEYPREAYHELLFNITHLIAPVENHSGGLFFHFNAMYKLYGGGLLVPYLMILGLITYFVKVDRNVIRRILLFSVIIVYFVFSFAETKMTSFTYIVSPFFYLGLASLVIWFVDIVTKKILRLSWMKKLLLLLSLVTISWMLLDYHNIRRSHTMWKPLNNHDRAYDFMQMEIIERIKSLELNPEEYLIFNAQNFSHIPIMFYTDYIAFNRSFTGYHLAMLDTLDKKAIIFRYANDSSHFPISEKVMVLDVSDVKRGDFIQTPANQ